MAVFDLSDVTQTLDLGGRDRHSSPRRLADRPALRCRRCRPTGCVERRHRPRPVPVPRQRKTRTYKNPPPTGRRPGHPAAGAEPLLPAHRAGGRRWTADALPRAAADGRRGAGAARLPAHHRQHHARRQRRRTQTSSRSAGCTGGATGSAITLRPVPVDDAVDYWTAGEAPLRLAAYYQVSVILLERSRRRPSRPGADATAAASSPPAPRCSRAAARILSIVVGRDATDLEVHRPARTGERSASASSWKARSLTGTSTTLQLRDDAMAAAGRRQQLGGRRHRRARVRDADALRWATAICSRGLERERDGHEDVVGGRRSRAVTHSSNETPIVITPRLDATSADRARRSAARPPGAAVTWTGWLFAARRHSDRGQRPARACTCTSMSGRSRSDRRDGRARSRRVHRHAIRRRSTRGCPSRLSTAGSVVAVARRRAWRLGRPPRWLGSVSCRRRRPRRRRRRRSPAVAPMRRARRRGCGCAAGWRGSPSAREAGGRAAGVARARRSTTAIGPPPKRRGAPDSPSSPPSTRPSPTPTARCAATRAWSDLCERLELTAFCVAVLQVAVAVAVEPGLRRAFAALDGGRARGWPSVQQSRGCSAGPPRARPRTRRCSAGSCRRAPRRAGATAVLVADPAIVAWLAGAPLDDRAPGVGSRVPAQPPLPGLAGRGEARAACRASAPPVRLRVVAPAGRRAPHLRRRRRRGLGAPAVRRRRRAATTPRSIGRAGAARAGARACATSCWPGSGRRRRARTPRSRRTGCFLVADAAGRGRAAREPRSTR